MNGAQALAVALGGVGLENILKAYQKASRDMNEEFILALLDQFEEQTKAIRSQVDKWRDA